VKHGSGVLDRRYRALQRIFVAFVPAVLLGVGNTRFILNHFYARTPYLLDSGWFAALVHRAGFIQVNPDVACDYARTYWGVHVSPFLSFFSLASYAFPLERIDWYAVFQGAVFAPLGCVWYLVASRSAPARGWAHLAVSTAAALAFAFGAQVLFCVPYPHFEIAIAAWICVLLASLATGRKFLADVAFVLALSVREDAGLHTGLALLPLWWIARRRDGAAIEPRPVLRLAAGAFAWSVVAVAIQKLGFPAPGLFRTEYLGQPAFAHINLGLVIERLRYLVEHHSFMVIPFAAAASLATWRRDAGYLLGYLGALPWFLVNLLAHQEQKGHFDAYTGFPFIVSAFWTYLYGALLVPTGQRFRPLVFESMVGAASIAATVAFAMSFPGMLPSIARDMVDTSATRRDLVRTFAERMQSRRSDFGRVLIDDAVGAVATDAFHFSDYYLHYVPGAKDVDAIAFHQHSIRSIVLPDLAALGMRCTHVLGTGFSVCHGDRVPEDVFAGLPTEEVPPLLAFALFGPRGERIAPRNGVVTKDVTPGLLFGALLEGLSGEHEVVLTLDVHEVQPGPDDLVFLEVAVDNVVRATARAPRQPARHELVVPADLRPEQVLAIRLWQRAPASFTISDAQLRRAGNERGARRIMPDGADGAGDPSKEPW